MRDALLEVAITSSYHAKIGHRTRLESWAWVYMRLSGVALLVLVFGHLLVMRVLVGLNKVNVGFVGTQWSGLGWRLYDLAMLQEANGLRDLACDHLSVRFLGWFLGAAYVVYAAATALGTYVIVAFARPL